MPVTPIRRTLAALSLLAILAIGGCDDDEGPSQVIEPELASMRITVASQEITISSTGVITGGPISIDGDANEVLVELLEDDGGPAADVTSADFRVEAVSGSTTVFTVARVGAFEFTFTGISTGTSSVGLALIHIDPNHTDFGPFNVPVEVNAGGDPL